MKLFSRIAAGLLMMLVVSVAMAGWSGSGKIQKVYFSSGRILIVHDFMADTDGCGRADYFILPQSNALWKEMYATLLAAQVAGQPVNLALLGCELGFPKIVDFYTINGS